MTRLEFFIDLRAGLQKLPPDEIENAVRYYAEYLDDAGEENEQKALEELGDPVKIAQQINAEYMVRDIVQYYPGKEDSSTGGGKKKKNGLSAIWIAILALFASPIALPIAVALAIAAISVVIAVGSVFFSLFIAVFAVLAAGFACVVGGICILFVHPPTGIAAFGAGLVLLGIGLFLFIPVLWLTRITFSGIARLISRTVTKRRSVK